MFKNKKTAAIKLAEKLSRDRVGERSVKIISLTSGGKPIADILSKNLNIPIANHPPATPGLPGGRGQSLFTNHCIIIVDDGSVSFSKLRGEINQLRQERAKKILVAMPVYEHKKTRKLEKFADGVYILEQPKVFLSAEDFYQNKE